MTTRVRAGHLLAWNGTDHVILADAELVYRGEEIVYVGQSWDGEADEEIDASTSLVMPGFIDLDALTDIDHCLLDSWADRSTSGGYNWSPDYAAAPHGVFTQEERATVREFAIAQLARHGVTTFMPIASEVHSDWAETYQDFVDVAEISQRIGLRGYLGPSYRSGVNVSDAGGGDVYYATERGRVGFEDAVAFLDYADGLETDLVHGTLLPCRIETLSMELMRETARVARERDVFVRLHCLQGAGEVRFTQREWQLGVVDALAEAGLLEAKLLIPHGRELGDLRDPQVAQGPDVRRLVEAGVPIIHCPLTSARYGSGLLTFEAYLAAGLHMVLGTDSFPPDLIRGIDVGVQVGKILGGSLAAGRVDSYVRAGTSAGADALGRPDLGRLSQGAKADFIVAELGDFAMGVVEDPVRTLVVNGSGRDIVRTVVAGRTVMLDGQVLGVPDMDGLKCRAQGLFDRMRAAYTERDHAHRGTEELFPASFEKGNGK
ncbi:chlorohydrolase family protein [Brevibacterium sp. 50QC2O2]|jgi:8-oxoguanine deaminase|uniref:chlorohydrolase family protein n=1 Tax=Brevibacterium sp. 50QC2O2 TaxID=2968459 RepID=UPI00211BE902|nr:chlorohydrolase family protein [Brevibacterium sp. 50QC2O2]MCQ9388136.1 chlorohydrolase family protein [Brevibacterium sp. 50QC2O2]